MANFQLLSLDSFTRKVEENETNLFSHNLASLLTRTSSIFLMAFKVFWKTFLSYLSCMFLLLSNSNVVSCLFQSNGINWKFWMSNYFCCQIFVVVSFRCYRRNHSNQLIRSTFQIHIRTHHHDALSNVESMRTRILISETWR